MAELRQTTCGYSVSTGVEQELQSLESTHHAFAAEGVALGHQRDVCPLSQASLAPARVEKADKIKAWLSPVVPVARPLPSSAGDQVVVSSERKEDSRETSSGSERSAPIFDDRVFRGKGLQAVEGINSNDRSRWTVEPEGREHACNTLRRFLFERTADRAEPVLVWRDVEADDTADLVAQRVCPYGIAP